MSKKALSIGALTGLLIYMSDSIFIGIATTIVILMVGFLLYNGWYFMKYTQKERMYKNLVYSYLNDGMSLKKALMKALSNLNELENFGLSTHTVHDISGKIATLEERTDIDNVIEIFSTFIYRYIFNNGKVKKPTNISDEKIIYALENLNFNERSGHLVIRPDAGDDFIKKYSN